MLSNELIGSQPLDHYGLVASICKKLDLAERIDSIIPKKSEKRKIGNGHAIISMIINGLGFINNRLYLVSDFFQKLPVAKLLGTDCVADDLNDDVLGRTLDEIHEYGETQLFMELVSSIVNDFNLGGRFYRLDTTSVNVQGEYKNSNGDGAIHITYGHSKDHRPDLKQFLISLTTCGPANIPIWFECLSGNKSDKESFVNTINVINSFQKNIQFPDDYIYTADSALYSKDNIKNLMNIPWISRVPESINEAKELIEKDIKPNKWIMIDQNYYAHEVKSEYGGTQQRWILVHSKAAEKKESENYMRNLDKKEKQIAKELWHLENQEYSSYDEAYNTIKKLIDKYPQFSFEINIHEKPKFTKRGRPKANQEADTIVYSPKIVTCRNDEYIQTELKHKGKFILATNLPDIDEYNTASILNEYKQLQNTERGFRFLKDPWFMASSVYLKNDYRISALMMVMILCLLVYNIGEYWIRKGLKESKQLFPNQKKKDIDNPTLRWIFQYFFGIAVVRLKHDDINQEIVTNVKREHLVVINVLGEEAKYIYGVT